MVVRGGVLVLERSGPVLIALPSGEPRPLELGVLADFVGGLLPSGDLGLMWVVYATEAGMKATLVGLDGQPVMDSFDLRGVARGGTSQGIVFSAGGQTYLTGRGGTALLIAGEALGSTADEVAVMSCDAEANCAPEVIDLASARTRRGPNVPGAADGSVFVSLSPDGWLATMPQNVGATQSGFPDAGQDVTLSVTDPTGRTLSIHLGALRSQPAWLPGDLGLMAITGNGVVRISEVDGTLTADPIDSLRPELDNSVIVITR